MPNLIPTKIQEGVRANQHSVMVSDDAEGCLWFLAKLSWMCIKQRMRERAFRGLAKGQSTKVATDSKIVLLDPLFTAGLNSRLSVWSKLRSLVACNDDWGLIMSALFQPFVPKAPGLVRFWMEGIKHKRISSFSMKNIQFMVNLSPSTYWLDIK